VLKTSLDNAKEQALRTAIGSPVGEAPAAPAS
jgi:hypothetical protein